jgi:hypothetical protein
MLGENKASGTRDNRCINYFEVCDSLVGGSIFHRQVQWRNYGGDISPPDAFFFRITIIKFP